MSDQPQALWQAAQQTLRGMLKTELYNLWFAPVTARCLDGDTLTLEVADEFCEFWLKDNYLDVLRSVVSRAAIRPIQVDFAIRYCERTIALNAGKVVFDGPSSTLTPQRLATLYGSSAWELFAPGSGSVSAMSFQQQPLATAFRS